MTQTVPNLLQNTTAIINGKPPAPHATAKHRLTSGTELGCPGGGGGGGEALRASGTQQLKADGWRLSALRGAGRKGGGGAGKTATSSQPGFKAINNT